MKIEVHANEKTKFDDFVEAITAIEANIKIPFIYGVVTFDDGAD